jgi:hypothetical protein
MLPYPYPPRPHYHGWPPPPYPYPEPQGFCRSCCHPISRCVCGCRECRKEAKELLVDSRQRTVRPVINPEQPADRPELLRAFAGANLGSAAQAGLTEEEVKQLQQALTTVASATAFIGGSCCVHLSIEYTSVAPSALVGVGVLDAERTLLGWAKAFIPRGYYIKEDIISTNPGATVWVAVAEGVARLRWCEVFSC